MSEEFNYEQLRADLIEYYGTAMTNGFPNAIIELSEVEKASNERLIQIGLQIGYDLNNYLIKRL